MKTLVTVIGLVMILEGIPYFTMPDKVKIVAEQIIDSDNKTLRLIGFALMAVGLGAVALMRVQW